MNAYRQPVVGELIELEFTYFYRAQNDVSVRWVKATVVYVDSHQVHARQPGATTIHVYPTTRCRLWRFPNADA